MTELRDTKRSTFHTSVLLLVLVTVAAVTVVAAWMAADAGSTKEDTEPPPQPATTPSTSDSATTTTTVAERRQRPRPIDRPGHLHWIVNKRRPLPAGYVPPDLVVPFVELRLDPSNERMHLRAPAARALERLFKAAADDGVNLRLVSGFRTYQSQAELYDGYTRRDGRKADQYSARPGTSEHQTGLAADIGLATGEFDTEVEFGSTPEGRWVAANAHRFGFIVRYPKGKQHITGYTYEPWHLRFVGRELATTLYRRGETMEEHFDLPPGR